MQTREDIIAQILRLMAEHGITEADLEEPENQPEPETSDAA